MNYDDLNKDLPERTIVILNRYFSKEKYDVTLLINCLTALLILPWERFFKYRSGIDINIENLQDWGLTKAHIKRVPCRLCGYNLREIVRHMRNATAHMNIKTIPDNNDEIEKIIFKDRASFEVEIPVADLKTFVIKLAQSAVEKDLVGTAHPTN